MALLYLPENPQVISQNNADPRYIRSHPPAIDAPQKMGGSFFPPTSRPSAILCLQAWRLSRSRLRVNPAPAPIRQRSETTTAMGNLGPEFKAIQLTPTRGNRPQRTTARKVSCLAVNSAAAHLYFSPSYCFRLSMAFLICCITKGAAGSSQETWILGSSTGWQCHNL